MELVACWHELLRVFIVQSLLSLFHPKEINTKTFFLDIHQVVSLIFTVSNAFVQVCLFYLHGQIKCIVLEFFHYSRDIY